MERKRITLKIAPSVILIIVLLLAGGLLLKNWKRQQKQALLIDNTAIIVTRIQTLGELTTACFYDELVLNGSKKNAFSDSPLGSIARDGFGKDVNDHLVIIARGTVRAGIDLQKMGDGSVQILGDSVIVRLPSPEYLDIIVNPTDFEIFAESGKWTQQQVTALQDTARERLIMEADRAGLKRTAYEGAMNAITDLLTTCGYTYIRFDHPAFYVPMPGAEVFLEPAPQAGK